MAFDLPRQPGSDVEAISSVKLMEGIVAPGCVESICQVLTRSSFSRTLGSLGLEEGQATPESLFQKLHVRGCGWVLKGGGEAEDVAFHVFWLHGGDVQEVVGIDVVDLGEGPGEENWRGRGHICPGQHGFCQLHAGVRSDRLAHWGDHTG